MALYLIASILPLLVAHLCLRRLNFWRRANGHSLPPSRPGLPILGNALDLPTRNEASVFREWSKELGSDVIYVNAAGTPIVVLDSLDATLDMLVKKSAKYSSRPGSIMMNELMGWDWVISNLPYGNRWRERRTLFQRHFFPANKAAYEPSEEEHVAVLVEKLRTTPEDFISHLRHFVGGIAFSITYGLEVQPYNDPYLQLSEEAVRTAVEAAVPGAWLVDFIPALKYVPDWMPGAGFKTKVKVWRALGHEMRDKPFRDTEANIAAGVARPSFVTVMYDKLTLGDKEETQRILIRDTAGMVFAAASDTTVSALSTMVLAMMSYPDVHKRAQAELDGVLQSELPTARDISKLPYLSALVKEVLRPVNWMKSIWDIGADTASQMETTDSYCSGIPHLSTEDDIFRDEFFIPKGTIVIPNVWAMLHNEQYYPDPETFRPERFLKDGEIDPSVRDPASLVFGFGRRTCPGAHIGQSTLFLATASILKAFDISKPVGPSGEIDEPSVVYGPGIVSHPVPFKCTITPRKPA